MVAPTFDVRLLGRFVVLRDGEEVPAAAFGGRLSRRLVRLLVARRGEHVAKDALVEALWPRRPPTDPVANLEVLVSRARRALGDPSLILTGPGGYAFTAEPRCRVDAEDLLAAVERGAGAAREGRHADALAELERAIGRWGGEPLAEDVYEDWAEPIRARLVGALQIALESGAEAALAVGDPRRAASLAERAVRLEPLRERASVLWVRALAASGDQAGALAAFDAFRTRYAEELGLDPSEDARELHARVLRGEEAAPAAVAAPAGTRAEATPIALPFVDREAELATTLRAERVVCVAGPSGSGKTRFLDELARRADVPVLRAAAVLPERDEPWGLARSVLREAVAVDATAIRSLPALSAAALLDVLPELGELREAPAAHLDRESRRALAVEAARVLLVRVAGAGAVLLVDDLQWADETSLRLLAAVAARVGALRLVLAYRFDELREGAPARAFLEELPRVAQVSTIELARLPRPAVEALCGDERLAAAIDEETSATPLVVAEVVRVLEEGGALAADASGRRRAVRPLEEAEARDAARSGERRAASARVGRLAAPERDVLESVAALGRGASVAVVAGIAGRDAAEALASLDALTRAGLVRLDEDGWRPAHDSIAEAALDRLEPGATMRLHLDVARVLGEREGEPAEVARHLAAGGDAAAAVDRYADAAELALARFANEEARRLAEAAMALEPTRTASPRLLAVRAEALARAGELDAAKRDLRRALLDAEGAVRADLLTRLALLESGSEDYEAAGDLAELALAAAAEDPRRRAEAHAVAAIVDLNLGDLERSELRAKTALELFEALGDARGSAGILDGRAMATFLAGRIREAADAFDRVARLFRDAGELLRVGTPRSTRGHALVFLARPDEGLADVEDALALSRALGHVEGECYALWHRAEALAALGRADEAVVTAAQGLEIAERIHHREWTAACLRGLAARGLRAAAGRRRASGGPRRRGRGRGRGRRARARGGRRPRRLRGAVASARRGRPASEGVVAATPSRRRSAFRVVARAVPVHDHDGLVADDPRVVSRGQVRHLARRGVELGAVLHPDPERSRQVVLEVRGLAELGPGDRLHVRRPAPPRLEHEPSDRPLVGVEDLGAPPVERADLVRLREVALLGLRHGILPSLRRHTAPPGRTVRRRPCGDLAAAGILRL
jgi:DNA-binding SARP family transcriptional activator/tetratricopeptide (TPR) repeat protein